MRSVLRRLSRRVRVRVTVAAAVVTLLAGTFGAGLFLSALESNLAASLREGAAQQASAVAARLRAGDRPDQAVASGKDDVVVQVVDGEGRVLATDHPEEERALATRTGGRSGVGVPALGDNFSVVAVAAGDGRLAVVGVAEEGLDRALRVSLQLVAVGVPMAVLLVCGVVWLAIGRALRPVERMRREAEAISLAHLHRRLPEPDGDDEIPRLALTLNEMLDRIDAGQRRQAQFVADASHELRSPLAVLRQVVELARRHPASTTVADLAEGVWAEEVRMEELVAALLVLARLDGGPVADARDVDLDDLVHREVERTRLLAPALEVDRSGVGSGQVHGDPVLLGQVVANLLSNAVRHAHGRVAVTLAETGDRVRLVVDDDGPGIAPEDRSRVLERFVRLDTARARDAGGAGLGLAIVSDVVAAHGGSVTVGESDAGGARFVVDLPAAWVRDGGAEDLYEHSPPDSPGSRRAGGSARPT